MLISLVDVKAKVSALHTLATHLMALILIPPLDLNNFFQM